MGDIWIVDSIAFPSGTDKEKLGETRALFPEAMDVYVWERPPQSSPSVQASQP